MKTLCLLTLNKVRSFKDVADQGGAFRLLAKDCVPKYPVGKRDSPSRRDEPAPTGGQRSLFEPAVKEAEAAVAESNKAAAITVEPSKPVTADKSKSPFAETAPAEKAQTTGPVRQTTGFCKKLWQQFFYGNQGGPAHGRTVQPELALEKVTVMKNDLNEDDLEVVLVKKKVGRGEKTLARLSKMEMTGDAWHRLTAPFRKKNGESAINPKAEKHHSPELSARA